MVRTPLAVVGLALFLLKGCPASDASTMTESAEPAICIDAFGMELSSHCVGDDCERQWRVVPTNGREWLEGDGFSYIRAGEDETEDAWAYCLPEEPAEVVVDPAEGPVALRTCSCTGSDPSAEASRPRVTSRSASNRTLEYCLRDAGRRIEPQVPRPRRRDPNGIAYLGARDGNAYFTENAGYLWGFVNECLAEQRSPNTFFCIGDSINFEGRRAIQCWIGVSDGPDAIVISAATPVVAAQLATELVGAARKQCSEGAVECGSDYAVRIGYALEQARSRLNFRSGGVNIILDRWGQLFVNVTVGYSGGAAQAAAQLLFTPATSASDFAGWLQGPGWSACLGIGWVTACAVHSGRWGSGGRGAWGYSLGLQFPPGASGSITWGPTIRVR